MLNLAFAPSADILALLAEDRILGAWRDPFDPPTIVVPNPAVGKWLSVRLAETPSIGCVANARMPTLERFLWDALGPDPDTALVNAGHLSQVICALLGEDVLGNDVYKPIRDYLYVGGNLSISNDSANRSIDAIKRVQLSARIARQFLEYEYNRPSVWGFDSSRWSRPGIDVTWPKGEKYFEGREHEAWQMDLYRRAHECLSKSESPLYTTLPHLYRRRREECARSGRPWCDVGSNPQIILFGVSKISHFHRNTLVEISQSVGVDMHVFLTNPCAEFWEDVDTSRRTRAPRRRWSNDSPDEAAGIKPVKPEDYGKQKLDMFADEEDHALLKLWGAAGKENIFLWCPQAQWNFEYHGGSDDSGTDINADGINTGVNADNNNGYVHGVPGTTLLQAIQRSLLSRNNDLGFINTSTPISSPTTPTRQGGGKDGSLQILACPDLSREVEEVRELILDMANENAVRDFSDIAVYMPDTDKYAPYIQRIFGAYPRGHREYIPFAIIGASGGTGLVARALSALIGIAAGGFNRALVFELLENPIVRKSRGFSLGDLERWEGWAEAFGMFRGYNAEQRGRMGDKGLAVTNEHTFERGMRCVLEKSAETGDELVARSAGLFLSLLKELSDLSAFFSIGNALLDIREAVEVVRRAIWLWFGRIGGGLANEAAELHVRSEALSGIGQIEIQYECVGRVNISRDEFLTMARSCVAAELPVSSTAWRGVTFAPLRASMVLPHRAIFAMGLCAAEFPGTNETPGWDLLSSKRIVGDSDRVQDNRFAFLELMHAARERLILSYTARDMQKDEELQPSSVVLELEEYLITHGAVDKKEKTQKCSARREVPWVVHETLSAAREAGRRHGSWDREQRRLAVESLKERVKHRHELSVNKDLSINANTTVNNVTSLNGDLPVNTDSYLRDGSYVNGNLSIYADSSTSAKTTDLWDIKQFLINPLEYHLCKTLGIRTEEDTGDMAATDEPLNSGNKIFALRKKVWIAILNNIFSDGCVGNDTLAEDTANNVYDDHVESGQAPEGHICRMEREELISWAKAAYAETVPALRAEFPNHQLVEKSEFYLPCDDFTVNVCHQLTIFPKVPANRLDKIGIVAFDKAGKPADNLKLWLDGVAMWLNEMMGDVRRPVVLVALGHGDKPKVQTLFMSMDKRTLLDVEEWLTGVLTQMLIDKRREHLPFAVIADIVKPDKKGTESYEERMQKLTVGSLRDYLAKKGYTTYTEAFNLTDAMPPETDDCELRLMAEGRYAPILGRWLHE